MPKQKSNPTGRVCVDLFNEKKALDQQAKAAGTTSTNLARILIRDGLAKLATGESRVTPAALGGANGGTAANSVIDGIFKVITREKIEIIAQFLRENGDKNPVFKTASFISAFELCLRSSDFDPSQLTRKLAANHKVITRCASIDQMLDQLEEVYNYHQQIKVPLAFNARACKKR